MEILLKINREAAIKIGNENFGEQIANIDLNLLDDNEKLILSQTETTLTYLKNKSQGESITDLTNKSGYYYQNGFEYPAYPILSDTSFDSVKLAIKWRGEMYEIENKNKNKKIADKIQAENDYIDIIKKDVTKLFYYPGGYSVDVKIDYDFNNDRVREILKTEIEEAKKLAFEENEKKKQERAIIENLRQKEVEKKQEKIKKWALENGSERTKLSLETGVGDWEKFAEDDFVLANLLPDFEIGANDGSPRKNPTLAELQEFVELQKLEKEKPDLYTNAQIEFVKKEKDYDYDEKFTELQIKVLCPNGQERWISKRIDIE